MLLLALIRGTNKNRVQFEGNCSFGPGRAHDLLIQPARAWLHPAPHPRDRPGLDPSLLARLRTVRAWQGPRGLSATRDPPWLCLRCRLGGGRGASAEPARPPADPPARRCLSGPGAALGSARRGGRGRPARGTRRPEGPPPLMFGRRLGCERAVAGKALRPRQGDPGSPSGFLRRTGIPSYGPAPTLPQPGRPRRLTLPAPPRSRSRARHRQPSS